MVWVGGSGGGVGGWVWDDEYRTDTLERTEDAEEDKLVAGAEAGDEGPDGELLPPEHEDAFVPVHIAESAFLLLAIDTRNKPVNRGMVYRPER